MTQPAIVWFRRDLRLADNPALTVAAAGAVVPVFVLDRATAALGGAPKWRLGRGLGALDRCLRDHGLRLIFRRGEPATVLAELAQQVGAGAVHWNRLYDPESRARDTTVKSSLKEVGLDAVSHKAHVLNEPWEVETGTGGPYKVFTPFWRAIRGRDPGTPLPVPRLKAPTLWPASDNPADWRLDAAVNSGAEILSRYDRAGEIAARDELGAFIDRRVARYATDRDRLDLGGTSGLGPHLSLGEISARQVWHEGRAALEDGADGAETFLKELAWREFAWHLAWHWPRLTKANWQARWDAFPWATEGGGISRWQRGQTGIDVVDSAMRELYVTGLMHNRARMIVASFLTKHMLFHWKIGADWFADCLTDWDPASNALGWQWVAGSGPDAAPYFRIFNPDTQAAKFDPDGAYRRRWLDPGSPDAQAFFVAAPRTWGLNPSDPRPDPVVPLAEGRIRALAAHQAFRGK